MGAHVVVMWRVGTGCWACLMFAVGYSWVAAMVVAIERNLVGEEGGENLVAIAKEGSRRRLKRAEEDSIRRQRGPAVTQLPVGMRWYGSGRSSPR